MSDIVVLLRHRAMDTGGGLAPAAVDRNLMRAAADEIEALQELVRVASRPKMPLSRTYVSGQFDGAHWELTGSRVLVDPEQVEIIKSCTEGGVR